jgi:peptidoglycan/xylan/chitin deacetylase (PgdA/CDA1 family)
VKRAAAASLLFGAALVVTGCAPAVDPGWTPPTWPAAQVQVLAAAPEPLDATTLPLTAQRISSSGVQARMAYLPGTAGAAKVFNSRIDGLVRAAAGNSYEPTVGAQGAGLGDRGCVQGSTLRPAAEVLADPVLGPGDGVAVVCDVVFAGGDLLGQRIRVVAGTAEAVAADTSTVLYIDTASGEVADGAGLWADGAGVTLRDDVVEAIRRDAGALGLAPIAPPDEAQAALIAAGLADTVPAADGGLVFTLPAGFSTPELVDLGVAATPGPLVIEVPAHLVAELGSPFGQRVAEASGSPYTGPAAVPAGRDWVDCTLLPCVALTYDDGPSNLTGRLLDEYAEAHAAATFFMLGQYASRNPDMVRRVADAGHVIGSHTWDHPSLPSLDDAEISRQLTRTRNVLRELSGQAVATFRPPYGEYDARVLAAAGQPAILWSVDTRDWAGPADDVLLTRAIDEPDPGGIVLFHDTHERSVRLAPTIIAGLRDRGFTPVTITQLFDGTLPTSGAWRSAG